MLLFTKYCNRWLRDSLLGLYDDFTCLSADRKEQGLGADGDGDFPQYHFT